ncbi:formamidopyrimidine-DNA glycosylase [Streptococcus canis]|nr:formamidopyrimidine-DNA glycosylase [Streptococcus canis]VTS71982.1 formamidopyrimidine-DNA glycosylase [Streptococcus canis]GAY69844.1 formamidopyrimidine-DNA glycosylase [Streptococcus canis]GEE06879.1 formamidopyrimidine-DNA glycosylase [Streptococcus canis]GFE44298.1 formamidopyrimidine-DNA glycosylase [Streptococcus canis]
MSFNELIMPELPEVETVRRGLESLVCGQEIVAVTLKVPKMVKTDLEMFALILPGQTIQAIGRRGKYLLIDLGQWVLVSHLRMEGKYLLFPDEVPDNKHFHVFFELKNGSTLVYQDVRKFGTFDLITKSQLPNFFLKRKLGPEPRKESFKLKTFEAALQFSKKPIKPHLLDQTLVAGLGNIYVDEVLWAAKIHPETTSSKLNKAEIKRLHDETIRILALGIEKGGSTVRTYRNALGADGTMQDYLQVYGQTGKPCSRCGQAIVKLKVGGRGTHICPKCQKKRP